MWLLLWLVNEMSHHKKLLFTLKVQNLRPNYENNWQDCFTFLRIVYYWYLSCLKTFSHKMDPRMKSLNVVCICKWVCLRAFETWPCYCLLHRPLVFSRCLLGACLLLLSYRLICLLFSLILELLLCFYDVLFSSNDPTAEQR